MSQKFNPLTRKGFNVATTDALYGVPTSDFVPKRDLHGLLAHWDFSVLTSLATSDKISTVPDQTGTYPLGMFVSATQPTKQTGPKGLPVARFAGGQYLINDQMGVNWPSSQGFLPPMYAAFVFKADVSQTQTQPSLITSLTAFRVSIDNTALNSGTLYLSTSPAVNGGPDLRDGQFHVGFVKVDVNDYSIYVDGYLVGIGTLNNVVKDYVSRPAVGGGASAFTCFSGDIGEIFLGNGRPGQKEISQITSALALKWGITVGTDAADGSSLYETNSTSDGSTTRIWTPAEPSSKKTLVIWAHPHSQTEAIDPGYFAYPLIHAANAKGWYMIASSMGGLSTWGNQTALTALLRAYEFMVTRHGTFQAVVLVGGSMGVELILNAIIKGTLPVQPAIYLIDGVTSMLSMYKTATYTVQIDPAYSIVAGTLSSGATAGASSISSSVSFPAGTSIIIDPLGTHEIRTTGTPTGAGPYTIPVTVNLSNTHSSGVKVSDYPTKTAGFDPTLSSVTNFAGIYARFMASSADTTVVKTTNTDTFAALISGTAAEASVTTHGAAHLATDGARGIDFVNFIKRATGQ